MSRRRIRSLPGSRKKETRLFQDRGFESGLSVGMLVCQGEKGNARSISQNPNGLSSATEPESGRVCSELDCDRKGRALTGF